MCISYGVLAEQWTTGHKSSWSVRLIGVSCASVAATWWWLCPRMSSVDHCCSCCVTLFVSALEVRSLVGVWRISNMLASTKFLTHAAFLLKCFDLFCSPVCSTHRVLPDSLSPCTMSLQIFLKPIALSIKYRSRALRRASTIDATSASVLDNVIRCVFDIHSTAAVYHEYILMKYPDWSLGLSYIVTALWAPSRIALYLSCCLCSQCFCKQSTDQT
jgi:hypothetical protein